MPIILTNSSISFHFFQFRKLKIKSHTFFYQQHAHSFQLKIWSRKKFTASSQNRFQLKEGECLFSNLKGNSCCKKKALFWWVGMKKKWHAVHANTGKRVNIYDKHMINRNYIVDMIPCSFNYLSKILMTHLIISCDTLVGC